MYLTISTEFTLVFFESWPILILFIKKCNKNIWNYLASIQFVILLMGLLPEMLKGHSCYLQWNWVVGNGVDLGPYMLNMCCSTWAMDLNLLSLCQVYMNRNKTELFQERILKYYIQMHLFSIIWEFIFKGNLNQDLWDFQEEAHEVRIHAFPVRKLGFSAKHLIISVANCRKTSNIEPESTASCNKNV